MNVGTHEMLENLKNVGVRPVMDYVEEVAILYWL